MAVTMNDVRAILDAEEPSYAKGVGLGHDALPHLQVLVEGDDLMLAEKAAHLAARIGGPGALGVLVQAAKRDDPTVRVAVAAAARTLDSREAERVLTLLVQDKDVGVRRVAVRSAAVKAREVGGAPLRHLLERVSANELDASVRKVSRDGLLGVRLPLRNTPH